MLTLDQFIFWPKLHPNAGFGIKNLKKISRRWYPRTPSPHGYTPCVGAQGFPLLGPRSRKPFPTSKFTTTPLLTVPSDSQTDNSTHSANWQAANSQRHALSFPLSIDGIKLAIFVRMNWIGDIRESDSTAYYQLQRASWFLTITHTCITLLTVYVWFE